MAKLNPSGPLDAQVAIIQANPYKQDVIDGEHNASQYGRYLRNALFEAGIKPSDVWWDYLTPIFPGSSPKAKYSLENQDHINQHSKDLARNLKALKNLRIVICLGHDVGTEFGVNDDMSQIRGYLFDQLKTPAPLMVTYTPQWLFNGTMEQEITFLNDLNKASRIAEVGYEPPEENFNISPTLNDVRDFCRDALRHPEDPIYADIESIGGKAALTDRDKNTITMVGVGRKRDKYCMCVPFLEQGGTYYWSSEEEKKVRRMLKKVFETCPVVAHNAEFDFKHLWYQNFGHVRIGGDTLLLHHALHPELPHDLGYIASVHTELPYWKYTLKKAKRQLDIENEKLRKYNCYDVLATILLEPILIKENEEQGTLKIYYEYSLPNLDAALEFNHAGMPVDASILNAWTRSLKKEQELLKETLYSVWPIYKDFNFNSDDQVKYLFYGTKPEGFDTHWLKYKSYDEPGTRKSKKTKTYQKEADYVNAYRKTKPFRKVPKLTIKMTRGKKPTQSTDDEMRTRLHSCIAKRIIEIKRSKKKMKGHAQEQRELESMLTFIEALTEYSANEKLLTTYTKLHIEPDGRMHGGFKPAGTKNGRLSSYGPNMQNIPGIAKKMFVAPEGWKFVQADYINLELVVLAYIANIKALKNIFERGLNAHDENTKFILGIDKNHKQWDMWRKVIKSFIFGRNYGGGLPGMYKRMLTGIKGLDMTFEELKEIDKTIYAKWPEFGPYTDAVTDEVTRTRTLRNPFGRIRLFLGQPSNIIREGLNFPIQSTAADIMSTGIKRFMKYWRAAKDQGYQFYGCCTVHDSLVVLAPDEEVPFVLRVMRKALCSPMQINEHVVPFDCEVTVSQSYKAPEKSEMKIGEVTKIFNQKNKPIDQLFDDYEVAWKAAAKAA